MSSSLGEGVLNRYWQTVLRSLMITSYRQTVFGIIIIIIIHEFHRDASLETKLQALFRSADILSTFKATFSMEQTHRIFLFFIQ